MQLEPDFYMWSEPYEGNCCVYPHENYPGEAQPLYTKESINKLLKEVSRAFTEEGNGWSAILIGEFIQK